MIKNQIPFSMKLWKSPIAPNGILRWKQALLLYLVSHGFILASWNAFFWDDWFQYSGSSVGSAETTNECVRWCIPLRDWTEASMVSFGPWTLRVLTFLLWPAIAYLFYSFLKRTGWLSGNEVSTVTIIFLVLPINGARVALITNYYLFSLTLFAIGAWMIIGPRRSLRLISLVPLFWSMFTASLQVFVFVLSIVLFIRIVLKLDSRNIWNISMLGVLTFLPIMHRFILPVIDDSFRITKDGYNSISLAFLARASLFATILMIPLFFILMRIRREKTLNRESLLLGLGLALIAVGTFPYLAVGHFVSLSDWVLPFLPDESDWSSRHQLLQGFGISLSLMALSSMFGKKRQKFLKYLVVLCVGLNLSTYSGYYLDTVKQKEFMTEVSELRQQLSDVSAVVIADESLRFNARGRWIRSYEWSAMIERSIGLPILADDDRIEYCEGSNPTKKLTITASNGRLKSLLIGRVGISVRITNLPLCSN
jgi:hypothetical protein